MNRSKVCRTFLAAILFAVPSISHAQATLFVTPAEGDYSVGKEFSVLIDVNTGGKPINAASAELNFDRTRLQVVSMGYSRSILSLWTETPRFSNSEARNSSKTTSFEK